MKNYTHLINWNTFPFFFEFFWIFLFFLYLSIVSPYRSSSCWRSSSRRGANSFHCFFYTRRNIPNEEITKFGNAKKGNGSSERGRFSFYFPIWSYLFGYFLCIVVVLQWLFCWKWQRTLTNRNQHFSSDFEGQQNKIVNKKSWCSFTLGIFSTYLQPLCNDMRNWWSNIIRCEAVAQGGWSGLKH